MSSVSASIHDNAIIPFHSCQSYDTLMKKAGTAANICLNDFSLKTTCFDMTNYFSIHSPFQWQVEVPQPWTREQERALRVDWTHWISSSPAEENVNRRRNKEAQAPALGIVLESCVDGPSSLAAPTQPHRKHIFAEKVIQNLLQSKRFSF